MPKIIGIKAGERSGGTTLDKIGRFLLPHRKWTDTYYVLGDTTDDTDETIRLTTPDLPELWDTIDNAICTGVEPTEIEIVIHPETGLPAGLWEVKVSYDNTIDDAANGANPNQTPIDPRDWRPVIRWGGELKEYSSVKDALGVPTMTTAFEPVVVELERVYVDLSIERYESYPFNPLTNLFYAGRCNSQSFWGAPKGTAFLAPIEAVTEIIDHTMYEHVSYKIRFFMQCSADDGSFLEDTLAVDHFLNYGYYHMDYSMVAGWPVRLLTRDNTSGHPIQTRLAENGEILAVDGSPYWVPYRKRLYANFADLSLGPYSTPRSYAGYRPKTASDLFQENGSLMSVTSPNALSAEDQ